MIEHSIVRILFILWWIDLTYWFYGKQCKQWKRIITCGSTNEQCGRRECFVKVLNLAALPPNNASISRFVFTSFLLVPVFFLLLDPWPLSRPSATCWPAQIPDSKVSRGLIHWAATMRELPAEIWVQIFEYTHDDVMRPSLNRFSPENMSLWSISLVCSAWNASPSHCYIAT